MTLIEILAVIIIIGILMSVLVKGVFGNAASAKAQANALRMEKIKSAIGQFRLQYNQYPTRIEDLARQPSNIEGMFTPLVNETELKDIYGNAFVYRTENGNRSFALTSLGQDGVAGGTGVDQDYTVQP